MQAISYDSRRYVQPLGYLFVVRASDAHDKRTVEALGQMAKEVYRLANGDS